MGLLKLFTKEEALPETGTDVVAEPMQRVNQELYKRNAELAVRNKTLALLRKLDEISLRTVGINEIAQQITTAIGAELGYEVISIALVDQKAKKLQWVALSSPLPELIQALEGIDIEEISASLNEPRASVHALGETAAHQVTELGKVFPQNVVSVLGKTKLSTGQVVSNSIVYPLRRGNEVLGVLTVSASRNLNDLTTYERESLDGLLGLVALSIYKARLYTDLQKTTAALENANEQLKDLDKAKSEFLSIASHQLYTPLTALRGYISMLLEKDFGEIAPKQKPVLDILEQSATRLITLIKDLLDISRIERGKLELKLESVDLAKMAEVLLQDLMPNAMKKKLKMEFHKSPQPVPHVVADAQRLRQVLLNFVDNSIKYTDDGHIDVYVKHEGDLVIFSVSDTGKGMTKEDLARLFNKFTRVGDASRYNTEGTGLGLYVAKQIVNEHHGEVTADSPGLGKGSTFAVLLPAEGTANSLKVGQKTVVEIKAAEAGKTETAPKK